MRNLISLVVFFSALVLTAQELTVMTYNIRLDISSDGENAWPYRKDFLCSQIRFYNPDIFGIQEGLPHQVSYLTEQLDGYNFIGEARNGGDKGEYSAIFYKTERFNVLKQDTFWLSETPDIVSKGWDAAFPRVCTYGLFQDRDSQNKFWVFNTHLDHKGELARLNGVELILKEISRLNTGNYPVIFTGDFNDTPESKLILKIKKNMTNTREVSHEKPFGSYGTFNGFDFCESATHHIDYIFISVTKQVKVKKYGVLTDSKDKKYPSDHFPVMVSLELH